MGLLDLKIIKKIKLTVEEKFPDMKGVEPTEKRISTKQEENLYNKLGVSLPKYYEIEELFRLSFKKLITTEDGFEISRIVKVLVDKTGNIFKISTTK